MSQASLKVFKSWVDPNLVAAYVECLRIDKVGLSITSTINPPRTLITVVLGAWARQRGLWRRLQGLAGDGGEEGQADP